MHHFSKLTILLAMTAGLSSGASALELRVGSGGPPTHPSNDPTYTTFIKKLDEVSSGAMTARHMGLEVATLGNARSNLQSGVLDVGNLLMLYFAADFPRSMIVAELATLGTSGQAMSGAVTEYLLNCKPCVEEFAGQGLVYLGTGSTSPQNIITTKPVRALSDMSGLRLRSGGAPFTRWAEGMGALPAEISFNEEYESIASGQLDGTMGPPTSLFAGKLYEIAPYVTSIPIGTFHGSSSFTTSQRTWNTLTEEQRGWLVSAATWGVAAHGAGFAKIDKAARDLAVEFIVPDASLDEASEKMRAAARQTAVELGASRYGIESPEEEVERFAALVEKWNALVADIDEADTAAMAALMEQEIYSKIDWTNYAR